MAMISITRSIILISTIISTYADSYDWSVWPNSKKTQFANGKIPSCSRGGMMQSQQGSQFSANALQSPQSLQGNMSNNANAQSAANTVQWQQKQAGQLSLSRGQARSNQQSSPQISPPQAAQANATQQAAKNQQAQAAAPQSVTGADQAALAGIGAALAAFGSMKGGNTSSDGNFSNFTQGSFSSGVITKNFTCNKSPLECQNEWNMLVQSIESNPQYQVITKQMSCGAGMQPNAYAQQPFNQQANPYMMQNQQNYTGTGQAYPTTLPAQHTGTISSITQKIGSIARAF